MIKTRSIILLSTFFVVLIYRVHLRQETKYNYLYFGSLDLKHHIISNKKTSNKGILFLGNSPVSGSNIPRNTTTADFLDRALSHERVYNLGSMEQSLPESMIYLHQASKFSPRLALIGLNPRTFPAEVAGKDLFIQNSEFLRLNLDPETFKKIELELLKKKNIFLSISSYFSGNVPSEIQLSFQTLFYDLRRKIFGKLYNKSIRGKKTDDIDHLVSEKPVSLVYIESFLKIIKKLEITPVFYFVPIHKVENVYNPRQYAVYKDIIKKFLDQNKTLVLDYDISLPSTNENFVDFIHRTPEGNQKLASLIEKDLENHDLL